MNVFSYRRIVIFACSAAALAVCYFATTRNPQHAQERNDQVQTLATYRKFARKDSITDAIRSREKELVRVQINNDADREALQSSGDVVQDLGSYAVISKSKGSALDGMDAQKIDQTVHLPGKSFDPIASSPAESVADGAKVFSPGKDYYVVQFGGVATDEWLQSIREAGAEVLQYVPQQAFFIYADSEAVNRISVHSRVRWIGKYLPDERIPQATKENIAGKKRKVGTFGRTTEAVAGSTFDIAVFGRADLREVAAKITDLTGGKVKNYIQLPNNYFNVLRMDVPLDKTSEIANVSDVVSFEVTVGKMAEDERAAQIVAGNYTSRTAIAPAPYDPFFQFGVDGTNVTVAVADDGVGIPGDGGYYLTSSNVINGPLRGAPVGALGHGHLNASIIAGGTPFSPLDPLGYAYGKGIAPRANIVNLPVLRTGLYTGTEADSVNDAVVTAGPNGVLASISNNSWGAQKDDNTAWVDNRYNTYTAQYDGFVRDASYAPSIDPLTMVFSAGNSGTGGLTQPKVAKNIIAVGNSENLRTEIGALPPADNMDDLSDSSSRGPAADGRIKPDIVAPGTAVTGGRSGGVTVFGNVDQYVSWSTGTSHSAPQVSGAAALFTQYWKERNLGQNPSPAMIKAAILNTGQEMNGFGTSNTSVPNGSEGWGRINMKYMIDRAALVKQVDQTVAFSNVGDTYTVNGSVNDPSRPVRVALVWTDPPGVADPALVNNLDLTVTVGTTTYRGNVFSGGNSVAGGSYDSVNNVEMVWLPAGIASGTPFTIKVSAAALNGDGILGNGDSTDQNFALVAYNFNESAPTAYYSISGRVVSQSGAGISKVVLTLTGQDGIPRFAMTNPFGYFTFQNVAGPQSYILRPTSKRYGFVSQNIVISDNLNSLVVTSINGTP